MFSSSLTRRGWWWSDVSSGAHSCCILSLPSNCLNSRFASFPGICGLLQCLLLSHHHRNFVAAANIFQHDYIKIMQFTCTLVSRDSVYCLLTFQHLPTQFSAAKWKTISSLLWVRRLKKQRLTCLICWIKNICRNFKNIRKQFCVATEPGTMHHQLAPSRP